MNEPAEPITVALRIPGVWSHPQELLDALPEGYRLTPETLILPDQTEIGFGALDADDQFAEIFRNSCREEPTAEELATVDRYQVNVCLSGPGGSLKAARTMMKAASAILRAGGAGVFIDNCALAHGATNWLAMTDDGTPDAVSFAFVGIVRGKTEIYTMGMHVLGFRDLAMKPADVEEFDIVDVIRYVAGSDKPVEDGHIIADLDGPRFRAITQPADRRFANSPMHNPFGRLKLVSMKDIAEAN